MLRYKYCAQYQPSIVLKIIKCFCICSKIHMEYITYMYQCRSPLFCMDCDKVMQNHSPSNLNPSMSIKHFVSICVVSNTLICATVTALDILSWCTCHNVKIYVVCYFSSSLWLCNNFSPPCAAFQIQWLLAERSAWGRGSINPIKKLFVVLAICLCILCKGLFVLVFCVRMACLSLYSV